MRATNYSPHTAETLVDPSDVAIRALETAIEQKALDVRGFDVSKHSSIADFYLIASGTSTRHVRGIVDRIRESASELGAEVLSMNGYENGEWVVVDYGDIIVHVLYEPTRQYFKLDDLWDNDDEMELPKDLDEQAKKLRTGMYR